MESKGIIKKFKLGLGLVCFVVVLIVLSGFCLVKIPPGYAGIQYSLNGGLRVIYLRSLWRGFNVC